MDIRINTEDTRVVPKLKTKMIDNQMSLKNIPFDSEDELLKLKQSLNRLKKLHWNGKVVIKFYPRVNIFNATAKLTEVAYPTIEQAIRRELSVALNELQSIAKKFEFSYQISITKK